MMEISFTRLTEADPTEIVRLMNDPLVRRQMPLTSDGFDLADADAFVAHKESLWAEHGFGPWAIWIEGRFAGWGGLQPEGPEAEIALVLRPEFWGTGRAVYGRIIEIAFGAMGLESVVIYLPPSRTRVRAIQRLGFVREGEQEVWGETFVRYRLTAPT
jgi:ribosomal-protein-alanine N-acetyltransferase